MSSVRLEIPRHANPLRIRSPLFPKSGQSHLDGLPIEEIKAARPWMNLGLANSAFEAAIAVILMFFSGRDVIHPATRAIEFLGTPNAIGHPSTSASYVRKSTSA
jgi:hypothetical protein